MLKVLKVVALAATASASFCGDGVIDMGEECDNGYLYNSDNNHPEYIEASFLPPLMAFFYPLVEKKANTLPLGGLPCRADCTLAVCGDGIIDQLPTGEYEECELTDNLSAQDITALLKNNKGGANRNSYFGYANLPDLVGYTPGPTYNTPTWITRFNCEPGVQCQSNIGLQPNEPETLGVGSENSEGVWQGDFRLIFDNPVSFGTINIKTGRRSLTSTEFDISGSEVNEGRYKVPEGTPIGFGLSGFNDKNAGVQCTLTLRLFGESVLYAQDNDACNVTTNLNVGFIPTFTLDPVCACATTPFQTIQLDCSVLHDADKTGMGLPYYIDIFSQSSVSGGDAFCSQLDFQMSGAALDGGVRSIYWNYLAPNCGEDLCSKIYDGSCRCPFCGDGILQSANEDCDDGASNSDLNPNVCRSDCTNPSCGDGVTDNGEACDDGDANSDINPNACRTNCQNPSCGDGVVDSDSEECDNGDENSDDNPNVCRDDCTFCGDGVVDSGEQCDDGEANSDINPNACRDDCQNPSCGDGVVDSGEECQPGDVNCQDCKIVEVCAPCLGKVTCFEFYYEGSGDITCGGGDVTGQTQYRSSFDGEVQCEMVNATLVDGEMRDTYRCCYGLDVAGSKRQSLGPNTHINECDDGKTVPSEVISVHTSCSVPIGRGCQFCNTRSCLVITAAESKYNGATCPCDEPVCGNGVTEDREECDAGDAAAIAAQDKSGAWCDENCRDRFGESTSAPDCECKGKVSYLNFDWTGAEIATFTGRKTGDLNLEKLEDGTYSLKPTGGDTVWTSTLGVNIYAFAADADTSNYAAAMVAVHTSCSVRIGTGCTFRGPGGVLTVRSGSKSLINGELCDYSAVPETCEYYL